MTDAAPQLAQKRDELLRLLAGYGSCAVAFSGGVDSAVVAKAARLALGEDGGARHRRQCGLGDRGIASGP